MGNVADLQWSTEGPDPSSPAVTVDLTVQPVLSAALAHVGVPVVSQLTLCSTVPVRGARLRLSVADAGGPLGSPVERVVDLAPGQTTVLDDAGLLLDPVALGQAGEHRAGTVQVELESGGQLLVEHRLPVQVLPAACWPAGPLPVALELLAAHVRPDDPAVTALLADASELLEQGTGSSALASGSDDADRVDEVVEALTWAMRRRDIRHSEPPADGTDVGQIVRTPGEVLDGRVGTSLDVVLTLAAACERAGVRPLLWIVPGHAFLGYWREQRSADTAATTDVTALVELVDQGSIRLVETTLLTDRGHT